MGRKRGEEVDLGGAARSPPCDENVGLPGICEANTAPGQSSNALEQKIKEILGAQGIRVIDFPYYSSRGISAEGCYLNFLQTYDYIFLPIFGADIDRKAIRAAEERFSQQVVSVRFNEIAGEGGCLNCISWEIDPRDTEDYREGRCSVVDFWMPNREWEGCDVDDPSA